MRYTTITEVIEQEIAPALGEHGNHYDLGAIARATYAYRVDTDKDGNELLNTAGFEQIPGVDFWETAGDCMLPVPFTVEIQAGTEHGDVWQAMHPAEVVRPAADEDAYDDADGSGLDRLARDIWNNQTVAEGNRVRVCVWIGADADTGTEPAAIYSGPDPDAR